VCMCVCVCFCMHAYLCRRNTHYTQALTGVPVSVCVCLHRTHVLEPISLCVCVCMQVLEAVLKDKDDPTCMSLIYANQVRCAVAKCCATALIQCLPPMLTNKFCCLEIALVCAYQVSSHSASFCCCAWALHTRTLSTHSGANALVPMLSPTIPCACDVCAYV